MLEEATLVRTGRLNVSRISYHANLQRASGVIIPLGVMAELTFGAWRALGLIARTSLSDEEMNAIAPVFRERLSSPFGFLGPEFDWAFASAPAGEALSALSLRFSESLFCAPPEDRLIKKLAASTVDSVLVDLRKARDDDFYLMLAEAGRIAEAAPSEDRTKLLGRRAA
jgi:hypothetical protein